MICIVQRVLRASVRVADEVVGAIDHGALLLVGVEATDQEADADELARKIGTLRWFPGRTPMDRTLREVGGSCLVVSQFTLAAELARGNRPSFTAAAAPERAAALYERVAAALRASGLRTATGSFGSQMAVEMVNDGPVTFVLSVRNGRVQPRGGPAGTDDLDG